MCTGQIEKLTRVCPVHVAPAWQVTPLPGGRFSIRPPSLWSNLVDKVVVIWYLASLRERSYGIELYAFGPGMNEG